MPTLLDLEVVKKLIAEAWTRGYKGRTLPPNMKLLHECPSCDRAELDFEKTISVWNISLNQWRGKGWHSARIEALQRAPFCGVCSSQEFLEVHHIVPFRVSQDNSQSNLIPLCRKCHRKVDEDFRRIEWMVQDSKMAKLIFWMALKERQLLVLTRTRQLRDQYLELEKQLERDIEEAWRRGLTPDENQSPYCD